MTLSPSPLWSHTQLSTLSQDSASLSLTFSLFHVCSPFFLTSSHPQPHAPPQLPTLRTRPSPMSLGGWGPLGVRRRKMNARAAGCSGGTRLRAGERIYSTTSINRKTPVHTGGVLCPCQHPAGGGRLRGPRGRDRGEERGNGFTVPHPRQNAFLHGLLPVLILLAFCRARRRGREASGDSASRQYSLRPGPALRSAPTSAPTSAGPTPSAPPLPGPRPPLRPASPPPAFVRRLRSEAT